MLSRWMERELILDPRIRLLGLVPLTCFLFHVIRYEFVLEAPGNLLWMCHVSALSLALGMMFSWASLVRVSALWSFVGLPLWIIDWVATGETSRVSVLSHVVVPLVAALAMTQVKAGRYTVIAAIAYACVVQALCRWTTSPELNVNMAHKPYAFLLSHLLTGYWAYWAVLTVVMSALLSLTALAMRAAFKADALHKSVVGEVVVRVLEAPTPPPAEADTAEPGFRLAPKISPTEARALAVARGLARPLPPPPAPALSASARTPDAAQAPSDAALRAAVSLAPKRTGLVVERSSAPQERVSDEVRRPRGFTLLEMMVVVAILGVLSAIAIPDMTPAVATARLRASADDVVSFVERARREAKAQGRCTRVGLGAGGRTLTMEVRTHANCFGNINDASWTPIALTTLPNGFTFTMTTLDGASHVVFRPTGRLRGNANLDILDDGAAINIKNPTSLPNRSAQIQMTGAGRMCPFLFGAAPPALTAPVTCNAPAPSATPPPPSGGGGGFC